MNLKITYRSDIDGLRAIAVLLVIFFYAGFSLLPGGFIGVDVFFVLSGFLITSLIDLEMKEKKFTFKNCCFEKNKAHKLFAIYVINFYFNFD
jgi:peptidoglycan/LPS O-acetylase OafA/YrhL